MISVVIPTCERPELVAKSLGNLTGADEAIISDDSSKLGGLDEDFITRWILSPVWF